MDWYERVLVDTGRAATAWALIGFLVTFAVTRGITRRIRSKKADPAAPGGGLGDIHVGGVHIHHQVWGILLVLLTGLLEFRFNPGSPWLETLAALFGVGAALTLDEFALWFYLDDVYWGTEGRKSIDAILIGGALGAALLMEATPVGAARGDRPTWLYVALLVLHLAMAGICFVKGKIATGMIGIVVPVIATAGAIRLAKPGSPWARRRYRGAKLARSERRFGPGYQNREERMQDLIGGTPDRDPPPPP